MAEKKKGVTKASTSKISKKKKDIITELPKRVVFPCSSCGTTNKQSFYQSVSKVHRHIGHFPTCKNCMKVVLDDYLRSYEDIKYAVYLFCRKFDIYFSSRTFAGAMKEHKEREMNLLGGYMKQLNSFREANEYGDTFSETEEFLDRVEYKVEDEEVTNELEKLKKIQEKNQKINTMKTNEFEEDDIKNRNDVFRILGYDPFEHEKEDDKAKMYTRLNDYLDENTQNDVFKIPICIQIVKCFNQAEKMDMAISNLNIVDDISDIAKLSKTRNDIIKSNLDMAKANGISANHSNNKSQGAGTLSGILKELQDKDLRESDVNLFDVGTSNGMKQVADVSNMSILDQLNFDENTYTDMIKEQRELIDKYRSESEKFEEELRLLRIHIGAKNKE